MSSTDNPVEPENLIAAVINAAEEIRDQLDGLVEKAAADPGAPFAPEALEQLATLKKENRAGFEALRAQLKNAGCRVTVLDEAIAEENGEARGRGPLLWDKIEHDTIKSIALQTGAPGMTTFAPFDIEAATQPRHVTERMEIEEFIEGEPNAPNYIRTRLRTLCEDFYRKGDPALFHDAASLEEIIRILDTAPAVQ
jgi:hypothetical protein